MADLILDGSAVTGNQSYQALRTVTFQSVLHGVAHYCGFKPGSRDWTAERAAMITEYINERVREAWEYAVWPDLRWIEQRYYHQGVWAAGSYAAGSIVYHAGTEAYYVAGTGTSEEPGTTAVDWTVTTTYSKLIPWEQLNATKIGNVERVLKSDPRVNRTPTDLTYKTVDREGIYVLDTEASTSVWLSLLIREPLFTAAAHDATVAYGLDDLSYWAATGECYRSLTASNTVADPSVSADWDRVEFPYVFASFVKQAAHADFLRSQKQFDVADRKEGKAFARLDDVIMRQGINQQLPMTRVKTRGYAVR